MQDSSGYHQLLRIQQGNSLHSTYQCFFSPTSRALAVGISRTSLLQSKDRADKSHCLSQHTESPSARQLYQRHALGNQQDVPRLLWPTHSTTPELDKPAQSWACWNPNVTGRTALLSSRALKGQKGLLTLSLAFSFKREVKKQYSFYKKYHLWGVFVSQATCKNSWTQDTWLSPKPLNI